MKSNSINREVFISGIGITKWNYFENQFCYNLAAEATIKALKDSETEWKNIEAVFSGSVYQGTGSGHQAIKEVGLTGIPIVNIENACSSSSSALRLAYQTVGTGIYDIVLVIGMEKMPKGPIPSNAFRQWELDLGFNLQPGNYALMAQKYMEETGASEEDFSRVTIKNRKNGSLNPNARFQDIVTFEDIRQSRMISTPLRLMHCCPIADGAVAIIISSKEKIRNNYKKVKISSSVLTSGIYGDDYPPGGMVKSIKYPPLENLVEISAKKAYAEAGIGPGDIDLAQVYDAVSPGELWDIEELGLCKKGDAVNLLKTGYFDINGKLPINTDGGLISRGHPLGATGGGQIYELVLQLQGRAGLRQIKKAKVGLAHAMGAGPNSAVTILQV